MRRSLTNGTAEVLSSAKFGPDVNKTRLAASKAAGQVIMRIHLQF